MEKPMLLDQLRNVMRLKHYTYRTEDAYIQWIEAIHPFPQHKAPAPNGRGRIRRFLLHLAREGHFSPSTQTQALNALVFLYHQVLHKKLGHLGKIERPTRLKRLPMVLSHEEDLRVLQHLKGMYRNMGGLLCGTNR